MNLTRRTVLAGGVAGTSVMLSAPSVLRAQQATNVRLVLDWALQGNHSCFTMAMERGHYQREGLNVTMDRGFGSGDTITKVASGAYDVGFSDITLVIPHNTRNPANKVTGVLVMFDQSMAAAASFKTSGIDTPKKLEGKRLAAPEGEGSRLLFPAFARAQGIDLSRISWTNVSPQLREAVLMQRQVDAITGFVMTIVFNLKANGVNPNDLQVFRYNDFGVDIFGSGVVASQAVIQRSPDTVRKFVKATCLGMRDALTNMREGVAQLKRREPLLNEALEIERFEMVRDLVMLTPNVRQNGVSSISTQRLATAVQTVAEAYNVQGASTSDTYTPEFLPGNDDRRVA